MTKSELSQYYYLCREIEQCERHLAALSRAVESGLSNSEFTAVIAEQREELQKAKLKAEYERLKIIAYVNNIDDSLTRMIIRYRYLSHLPWQAVAYKVGGSNTADSVRKIAYRYIKKDG